MGSTGSGPIQNLQNGLCLGVTGSKSTYGYPLAWQTCSGSTAQQFSLIPGATAGYSLIQLPLSSTGNTAYCIDVGNAQINYNCSTTNSNQVFYTPNMQYSNTSSIICDDGSQTFMTLPGNGNKFKDVMVKYGRWDNNSCPGTGVSSNTNPRYVWSKNAECDDKNYCSIFLPTTDPYFGVYKQFQIFSNNVGGSPYYITIGGGFISKVVHKLKTYILHTFTTSGTFTVKTGKLLSAFYLVVGGGGNGGNSAYGSGGGGGSVVYNDSKITINSGSYSITVGGQGSISKISISQATEYSAQAGGNGTSQSSTAAASGGNSHTSTGNLIAGGSGNKGGGNSYGGGGAAMGSGRGRGGGKNQDGQNGLQWWLNETWYGGGGGGGVYSYDSRSDIDGGHYGGAGGWGGGGNGGLEGNTSPSNATSYGGGGGGGAKSNGASGYQGVVIIAYCPEDNVNS
jgi:hypothetical protein